MNADLMEAKFRIQQLESLLLRIHKNPQNLQHDTFLKDDLEIVIHEIKVARLQQE